MATTHAASSPALSTLRTVYLPKPSCDALARLFRRTCCRGSFLQCFSKFPATCSLVNLFLALTVTARSVPIFSRQCCPHNQSGCQFQPLANNESRLPRVVAFQELNSCAVPLKADDKDPHSVSYQEGAAILEQMLISLAIFRRYSLGKCSKSLDISANSDRSPVIGQIRCRSNRDHRSNALLQWNWIIRLRALSGNQNK